MKLKSKIVYVAFGPILLILVGLFLMNGQHQVSQETEIHSQKISYHSKESQSEGLNVVIINSNQNSLESPDGVNLDLMIGGEIITVPRVNERRYSVNYEFAETGAGIYKDLSAMAKNGDALAARELGQQLGICKESFRGREPLEKEIESINRSFEAGNLDDHRFEQGNYASVLNEVKYMQESFEFCESLDDDTLDEEIEFYEIASDLGDFTATELLAAEYLNLEDWDNYHRVSLDLWNDHGGAAALHDLLFLYSSNKVEPPSGLLDGQPIDVLVHAINILASETYFESAFSRYPDNIDSIIPRSDVDANLSDTSETLTPAEHVAAEQMAIDLLRSNENCCRTSF